MTVATKPAIDEVRKLLDYYADEIDVHIWQEIASALDDIPDCETWTAVPHSERVQGEPTDAVVIRALEAYWGPQSTGFWFADQIKSMRAALRAAGVIAEEPEGEHVFLEAKTIAHARFGGLGGDVSSLTITREAWKSLGESDVLAVSVSPVEQEPDQATNHEIERQS